MQLVEGQRWAIRHWSHTVIDGSTLHMNIKAGSRFWSTHQKRSDSMWRNRHQIFQNVRTPLACATRIWFNGWCRSQMQANRRDCRDLRCGFDPGGPGGAQRRDDTNRQNGLMVFVFLGGEPGSRYIAVSAALVEDRPGSRRVGFFAIGAENQPFRARSFQISTI